MWLTWAWSPRLIGPTPAPESPSYKLSNSGRIKFTTHFGGDLFAATDELKATDNGSLDIAPDWVPAYNINDSAVFGLGQVPFLWEGGLHIWYAYQSTNLAQIFINAVESKFNVKVLYWGSAMWQRGTNLYYKGNDILTPDPIKGLKLRATDAFGKEYVDTVGGAG